MDFQRTWYNVKKKTKRLWKKTKKKVKRGYRKCKRAVKKYFRMLIRHTKAGDYSILTYTIIGIILLVLIFSLIGKAFSHKKDKKEKITKPPIETPMDAVPTMTDAERAHLELVNQAKVIYENNRDLLLLVNTSNPIPDNYSFEHHTLNCGYDIDERIFDDLLTMLTDLNGAGLHYSIVSAYRTREYQQTLVDSMKQMYMGGGMTEEEALAETYKSVQIPGYSEHETGLCLDISAEGVYAVDASVENYETNQWLMANCQNYGFILRYPKDKEAVTGIAYEAWHFRYVGYEASMFMYNNNLTLEEFYMLIQE